MQEQTRMLLVSTGMYLDQTLARFVGNESLLLKFLGKFAADETYAKLATAMEAEDTEDAFHQAHTLKGVAGNLGLGTLFDSITPVVEALRMEDMPKAKAFFPAVEDAHAHVMHVLGEITAG